MTLLSYMLYYGVIYPLSKLPFSVLYKLADFIYILIYRVFGYRKKVVLANLRNSFPEKSEKEIQLISAAFYRHFCRIVVESIKAFTMSSQTLQKHFIATNTEILDKYYQQKRSVILVTGHYGNWEWAAISLPLQSKFKTIGLFQPLKNKFLDLKMKETRGKYGLLLIPPKETGEYFLKNKNDLVAYGFVADQSPSNPDKGIWLHFLNQPTSVLGGTEKYAKLYNCVVIYGQIESIKKGFYTITYRVLCENPQQTSEGEITSMHTRVLEEHIKKKPEYWLWTHRRWKHKPKVTS